VRASSVVEPSSVFKSRSPKSIQRRMDAFSVFLRFENCLSKPGSLLRELSKSCMPLAVPEPLSLFCARYVGER
jgi:hypothetical protein